MYLRDSYANYLFAVECALEEERVPAQYITATCPECNQVQTSLDNADHLVMRVSTDPAEICVVIACEEYWVINPNAIGIDDAEWSDWTKLADDIIADDFRD